MICDCKMRVDNGHYSKTFRHPIGFLPTGPKGQPGKSPDEPETLYTACGGAGMVWIKGACKATVWDQNAGAGLAPGLAAGLAAAVASVSVY